MSLFDDILNERLTSRNYQRQPDENQIIPKNNRTDAESETISPDQQISRTLPFPSDETEPMVGIFWTYNGKLFHHESSPCSKAVQTRISIDYAVGHYAAWFIMEKKGLLKRLPPHMRDEYDSIPRGRVVYLFDHDCFVIYHGDDFNEEIRGEIMNLFRLPLGKIRDEVDEHYNPLPDDYLF